MKKLPIILSILFFLLMGLSTAFAIKIYIDYQNDKTYYEGQLEEYRNAMGSLSSSFDSKVSSLNDANTTIREFKQEMAQLQAELNAYKDAIDQVNAERTAKNEKIAEEERLREEEWNALTDILNKSHSISC